jgi:hypothetical protein
VSEFTAPGREGKRWLRPICWIRGHDFTTEHASGPPDTWRSEWQECQRCALVRGYHYL